MANTGFKGINVRQTGGKLLLRAFLQTSAGALLGVGTTTAKIEELQDDGTIKSFDFNSSTFKSTALTTPTTALSHQLANNATETTGFWTAAVPITTGFTVGAEYVVIVNNASASFTDQCHQFQFGGAEGDLVATANGTGIAEMNSDVKMIGSNTISASTSTGIINVGSTQAAFVASLVSPNGITAASFAANVSASALVGVNVLAVGSGILPTNASAQSIDPAGRVLLQPNQTNVTFNAITVTGNLSIGGNLTISGATNLATLANQTSILSNIAAITTNTSRGKLVLPYWLVRPGSGSIVYEIDLNIYSLQGQLETPDAAPTIHARNPSGTSLDAGLSSTTMTLISTGKYKVNYTVNSTDTAQEVLFDTAWTVGSVGFAVSDATEVQDAELTATTAAIKAKTDLIATNSADSPNTVTAQNSIATLATGVTLAASQPLYTPATFGQAAAIIGEFPVNFSDSLWTPTGHLQFVDTVNTSTNVTNAPTAGDFNAAMKTSLNAAAATAGTITLVGTVETLHGGTITSLAANAISPNSFAPFAFPYLYRGQATGGSINGITLDAAASTASVFFTDSLITLTGGTGAGQSNVITNMTAGVCTVATNWAVVPDTTSLFTIIPLGAVSVNWGAIRNPMVSVNLSATTVDSATTLSLAERQAIGDALLDRNMSVGTDSGGRTVRNAFRMLRNKVDLASTPGSMTVYKEDDTTPAWTAVLTTNGSAQLIVTVDPG